jgi:Uma2 family endonuclease
MEAIQTSTEHHTVEKYLELEDNSILRREFVEGETILMPPETLKALEIANNLVVLMKPFLKRIGFKIHNHDVRTVVREKRIYRYPDIVVNHITDDSDKQHVKYPVLIVEVTSKDTCKTDRKTKLLEYTHIKSMQHYIIVDQDIIQVEMYSRHGNRWFYDSFTLLSDVLELPIFDIELSLTNIYEDVILNTY